ncbi:Lysine methyltransferase [Microdochium nivale]|nr:Lysine methyltransferase [Microdochium nivale]
MGLGLAMHYIRLLRPPAVEALPKGCSAISLLLTITTDLGDTFLYPPEPINLEFVLSSGHGTSDHARRLWPADQSPVSWRPGMRVLKTKLALDKPLQVGSIPVLSVSASDTPTLQVSLALSAQLLPWYDAAIAKPCCGLIAPLAVEVTTGAAVSDVAIRDINLTCGPASMLKISIEEDMGESIARHIWDAGLATAAFLADSCWNDKSPLSMCHMFPPSAKGTLNILELGSGVGVLGISIAVLMPQILRSALLELTKSYVLMTDLAEAQERAKANIARCQSSIAWSGPASRLEYENLDWQDGSVGSFGAKAGAHTWDLVVLSDCTYNVDVFPLLVTTLSAIHAHNCKEEAGARGLPKFTTKVLMSTKPRHDSERTLFEQLTAQGWAHQLEVSIPMPRINEEGEAVEIYTITKCGAADIAVTPAASLKRKGCDAQQTPNKKTPGNLLK